VIEHFEEPESCFETNRKRLMAELLEHRQADALITLSKIVSDSESQDELTESEQKSLRQTIFMLKRLDSVIPELSVDIVKHQAGKIKTILGVYIRKKISYSRFDDLKKMSGLSDSNFDLALKNMTSLQITSGCSNACRRCNEWALPGIRKHIRKKDILSLTETAIKLGNIDFTFYCASDPLDYKDGLDTISDILDTIHSKGHKPVFGLLTKLPSGSLSILEQLILNKRDIAISITNKNRTYTEPLIKKHPNSLSVQHDSEDLLIPAGLDEDFSTVKSSITDNYGFEITPEETFQVIPTYTSALNPTGQYRIPTSVNTRFIIKRKTGRHALAIDYFKPLTVINEHNLEITLNELTKPQIENILLCRDDENISPPGMMTLHEFFKSFEDDAVNRRKKIFPSVIQTLRQDKTLSSQDFRNKLIEYHDICNHHTIIKYKTAAFSFFLKSIQIYLKKYKSERTIVRHLRRDIPSIPDMLEKDRSLVAHIKDKSINSYLLLQHLLDKLLVNPENKLISEFIHMNPSLYHSISDRFMLQDTKSIDI